jgi:hypothetical protein
MNWLHFLLWITGIYALYYLVIMLKDIAGCRGSPAKLLVDDAGLAPNLQHHHQENSAPDSAAKPEKDVKARVKINPDSLVPPEIPAILEDIKAYENTDHKSMVHVRFDAKTVLAMNHFKLATGIDMTRLIAFSVRELFRLHPELKIIIKQFIQNLKE